MTTTSMRFNRTLGIARLRDEPLLAAFGSACALLILIALIGPVIAPYPPDATDILASGQGPSGAHLLGTDSLGRDILSRILVGAQLSFLGPAIIVAVSAVVGTAIAITAAWYGGWIDRLLVRVLNVMFAVPGILVAVLAAAIFGAGFWAPVIALSLVYIPFVARVVRSAAVRERNLPYIEACQLAGLSTWRICTRHILRNLLPIILAQSTIGFGSALMDFGATSFLGLGVQPPQAEWGVMVNAGNAEMLTGAFQQSLAAGFMIVITVVSFNILGERLASRKGAAR